MICPKHSVNSIALNGCIGSNVIDIIYVDELEIHTVSTYHCAIYSVKLGRLLIVLYLSHIAKALDTPALR